MRGISRTVPDARGIVELTARRVEVLADIARERAGDPVRACVSVHRRACEIVMRHDDKADCTCLPIALWFGASA